MVTKFLIEHKNKNSIDPWSIFLNFKNVEMKFLTNDEVLY
jgi:hypothetical protein